MDEFPIGTSPPAIAGFRGTQFVAVWPDGSDGNIKGQMLSTAGKKAGDEFRVNFPGPPATKRRLPIVAETAAGSSSHGPTSGRTSASARSGSGPTARRPAPSSAPTPYQGCTGFPWLPV